VSADARSLPLVELKRGQIQRMLARLLAGANVVSVEQLGDGLVNRVYRVVPTAAQPALALRTYA
jgi:hypothetical protein